MNLIAFPHYTCGGLLCDIFNKTFSEITAAGGIASINHNIGKIGDADSIFDNYDTLQFEQSVEKFRGTDVWIGTHCWPGVNNLSNFDTVILVTTATYRSKIYRWARAYYHYYSSTIHWTELHDMERLDKERETAKNYLKPFLPLTNNSRVLNVEFSEVVENTGNFKDLVKNYNVTSHIERWQRINSFLYDKDFWSSTPVQRYYEAELEVNLNTFYKYH